jgi:histidinol-phosphate aminotransferase
MSRILAKVNPQLERLPVYVPGRPIEAVARELGLDPASICKLASNENPLGPSPRAVEAMRAAIQRVHLYPDGSAHFLRERMAGLLDVPPANLVFGNGSNEILEMIAHGFLGPGDEVVVSQYCFAVYPIVTALAGATLVTVPVRDHSLQADIPALLRAIGPRTKAVFLANPNNPTGTLTPREAVSELIAGVPEDVLLVMDEAYIEFLEDPVDCLDLVRQGTHPNLFLTRTFSKVFGLAGLRLGYGMGDPGVVAVLEKVRQPFNVNLLAQEAALAALTDADHLARTRANNRLGLDYLQAAFRQEGWEYIPSHANFVLVRVGDGHSVFKALQAKGIITRPMGSYGLGEWLRISVGTPAENHRCLEALRSLIGRP